jgi:hypothetical protein
MENGISLSQRQRISIACPANQRIVFAFSDRDIPDITTELAPLRHIYALTYICSKDIR